MVLFAQALVFMLKVVGVVEDEPLTTTTTTTKSASSNLCQGFIYARDSSEVFPRTKITLLFSHLKVWVQFVLESSKDEAMDAAQPAPATKPALLTWSPLTE